MDTYLVNLSCSAMFWIMILGEILHLNLHKESIVYRLLSFAAQEFWA